MATTQAPPVTAAAGARQAVSTGAARPEAPARPAAAQGPTTAGPRKVRLTVARVDPWSVLKLSFLLSVALGVGLVTASVVLWSVLNSMGVFSALDLTLKDLSKESQFDIYSWVGLGRVVSLSTFIAVVNVVILMALSTLGAVLYNLASSLVGGLHVTLSDD